MPIASPDIRRFITARDNRNKLDLAEENRSTLKQAGGLLAQDNATGARNKLFEAGLINQGVAVEGLQNKRQDRATQQKRASQQQKLAQIKQQQSGLERMAQTALSLKGNPQAYNQYIQQLKSQGVNVPVQFEDPANAELAARSLLSVKDQLELQLKEREIDLKRDSSSRNAKGIKVDTKTGVKLVNPFTGEEIRSFEKDVEGAEARKQRARNQEKIRADRPRATAAAINTLDKADDMIDMAKKLSKHPGLKSATGPIDSRLPTVFSTTATFETDLDTLKTKIFVQAVNEMRELSKTGGALGSVTEREIEKMENSMRNLSTFQDDRELPKKLMQLAKDLENSKRRIRQAYVAQFGDDKGLSESFRSGSRSRQRQPATQQQNTIPQGFKIRRLD